MATTNIASIYDAPLFARFAQEKAIELNSFIQSGIVVSDALIAQQVSGGGSTLELPQFNGLVNDEPNYSDDVPGNVSTPANVTSKKQIARVSPRNKSWSIMNLANELALDKPASAITSRQGQYFATDFQKRVINSSLGILADNVANDSSDMLETVYSDIATPLAANKISENAIVDARQTLGDHGSMVNAIAVHSKVYSDLSKLGILKDNFDPATNNVRYQTFMGLRVILDDDMTKVAGTNSPKYTSILFGSGAFGTASAPVDMPSELERLASTGNGGGQTIIHARVSDVIHPYGFQNLLAGTSKIANSYAELETAARWDRVVDRKNVAIAFLETN